MIDYQFRPIKGWPGALTKRRVRSQFKATYTNTLDLLDRELSQLRARNVVIQADLNERDVRNDGLLRADARPKSPAIILSFETKDGPLSFPCDRFDRWQDNLRAITLALEALRKVDRYGITKRGEQYQGWKQLPPASGFSSMDVAAQALAQSIFGRYKMRAIVEHFDTYREARKMALANNHPDRGGNPDQWHRVQQAVEFLDLNHPGRPS